MTLHEKLLQTYCNYTGGMPYWDEQVDADNITLSAVWDSVYGIGGDGDSSNNQIVTDGPFANMEMHVGAWSFNTVIPKTATYHLNRSISVTTFQAASQSNVDECYALDSYNEAWQCYGQGPHSAGHAGTGGTVSLPSAQSLTSLPTFSNTIPYRCKTPFSPPATPSSSCTTRTWTASGGSGSRPT